MSPSSTTNPVIAWRVGGAAGPRPRQAGLSTSVTIGKAILSAAPWPHPSSKDLDARPSAVALARPDACPALLGARVLLVVARLQQRLRIGVSTASNSEATGAEDAAASAFPVTVEHKFGEHDGAGRAAAGRHRRRDRAGQRARARRHPGRRHGLVRRPAVRDLALGAGRARRRASPKCLSSSDGFEFEKIAALEPDLIVGTNAGMTKQDYEKLSALAPTIAQSGDYSDYFEPWDVQHLAIGKALGQGG